MTDMPGSFLTEDTYQQQLDELIDPDSRNNEIEDERRVEAENEFYDGDQDQDGNVEENRSSVNGTMGCSSMGNVNGIQNDSNLHEQINQDQPGK